MIRKNLLFLFTCMLAAAFAVVGFSGCALGTNSASVSENVESGDGFRNADLGNGWQVERSLELDRATQFTIDYYGDGYALACIADGSRYLVVPEGAAVPDGIADDIVVLQQPIGDVYLAASDTMCLLDALGRIDIVTVSAITRDNWAIPAAVDAMDAGRIVYGGKYSAPDFDLLLQKGCRLSIQSTMINHAPEVREKLVDLGIPVLVERSSYEQDPLGRTEWVKLYGVLLGEEALASRLYEEQVSKAVAVSGENTGKTVAFFCINTNGAAVVRKPGDYVTKMIAQAGGAYVFDSLGNDSATATVTLEMEQFYVMAKDADVIVYNATIDGAPQSIDDLVAKNALLGNFKAVREGNVWVTDQDMYQQMMNTGDIIADFHAMLTGSGDSFGYLRKLD